MVTRCLSNVLLKQRTTSPFVVQKQTNLYQRWSDINFDKTNNQLPEAEQPNYNFLKLWGITDLENKSYVPLEGYNQSKVANLLFSISTNKKVYDKYGILSFAVHPGVIKTELGRNSAPELIDSIDSMREKGIFSYRSLEAGASTILVAALDPKLGPGEVKDGKDNYGTFLTDCQITNAAHPLAVSNDEADRLWQLSENLVKEKFSW